MRDNFNLTITHKLVKLVPYRVEHVPVYHEWMKDPWLQQLTASEPLTLEQEYEMQQTWAADQDKCTFIVLNTSLPDTPGTGCHGGAMAGDVNLFINDPDDKSLAEIEVMIAEAQSRRKGLAKEAVQLLMAYAVSSLKVSRFRAKILEDNHVSLGLFQKLGYKEVARVKVFQEVHLELDVATGHEREQLLSLAERMQLGAYDRD